MESQQDFQKRRRSGPTYFDVGKVGRKTGIKLPTNIAKNEDGFDDLEDFFKKAEVPAPKVVAAKQNAMKVPFNQQDANIDTNVIAGVENSYSEYSEYSNIFENVEENNENYNPRLQRLQQLTSQQDNYVDFKVNADSGFSTPSHKGIVGQISAFGSTPMRGEINSIGNNEQQQNECCDVSQIEENTEILANISLKSRDSMVVRDGPQSTNNGDFNQIRDDAINDDNFDYPQEMDQNEDFGDNVNEVSFANDMGTPTKFGWQSDKFNAAMDSEIIVNKKMSKTMIKIEATNKADWISPLKGNDMVTKETKKKVVYLESDGEDELENLDEDSNESVDETYIASENEDGDSDDEKECSIYVEVDEECDKSILASQNLDDSSTALPIAVRKSTRTKVEPLKYWENEQVILDKRKSGGYLIKDVIRGDNVSETKVHSKKKKTNTSQELREAGFRGKPFVRVMKDAFDDHLEEIVKVPSMMIDMEPDALETEEQGSSIMPGFDTQFFSSGILYLPPMTTKSDVKTGSSTMVFHVLAGTIVVKVNNTTFKLKNGSHFYVPPSNNYELRNQTKSKVKLLFFQAKN